MQNKIQSASGFKYGDRIYPTHEAARAAAINDILFEYIYPLQPGFVVVGPSVDNLARHWDEAVERILKL